MNPFPRALRVAIYLALAAIGAILVAFAANQFDEALDPEAAAYFESGRMPPLTGDRGFALLAGLSAPVDQDPRAYAVEWSEAIARAGREGTRFPERAGRLRLSVLGATELLCHPETVRCIERFRGKPSSIDDLMADNAVLLRRYDELQQQADLADAGIWAAFDAPNIDYAIVLAAQSVLLSGIAVQAGRGDWDGAIARLETDAAFHRRWLSQGRTVISKMVVVRSLSRDLLLALQIAEAMPAPTSAQRQALARIAAPLDDEGRAMRHALRFEAAVFPDAVEKAIGERKRRREAYGLEPMGDLVALFALRNATLNFGYRPYAVWERLDRVESRDLDLEVQRARIELDRLIRPDASWLHNAGGKYLVALALPIYDQYILRVRDLDALARLVCAAMHVRFESIPRDQVASRLSAAAPNCGDPYTGRPFAWDEASGELWFRPLAPVSGERFGGTKERVSVSPF